MWDFCFACPSIYHFRIDLEMMFNAWDTSFSPVRLYVCLCLRRNRGLFFFADWRRQRTYQNHVPIQLQFSTIFHVHPKIARACCKKKRIDLWHWHGFAATVSKNICGNGKSWREKNPLYIISFELLSHGNELIFQYFRYLTKILLVFWFFPQTKFCFFFPQ